MLNRKVGSGFRLVPFSTPNDRRLNDRRLCVFVKDLRNGFGWLIILCDYLLTCSPAWLLIQLMPLLLFWNTYITGSRGSPMAVFFSSLAFTMFTIYQCSFHLLLPEFKMASATCLLCWSRRVRNVAAHYTRKNFWTADISRLYDIAEYCLKFFFQFFAVLFRTHYHTLFYAIVQFNRQRTVKKSVLISVVLLECLLLPRSQRSLGSARIWQHTHSAVCFRLSACPLHCLKQHVSSHCYSVNGFFFRIFVMKRPC